MQADRDILWSLIQVLVKNIVSRASFEHRYDGLRVKLIKWNCLYTLEGDKQDFKLKKWVPHKLLLPNFATKGKGFCVI